MTLSFYMDVHVPAAITEGLRRCGKDLELIAKCCSPEDVENQVIFLPL